MRGRAIRTYKLNPNKTANIWHLVTLEPEYIFEENVVKKIALKMQEDKKHINSCDYNTLCRRFDCFVGPNYETDEIESGIERITYIKDPYTKNHIEEINNMMFKRSKQRDKLSNTWNDSIVVSSKIIIENKVPKECKVPTFTYVNIFGLILAASIQSGFAAGLGSLSRLTANPNTNLLIVILVIIIMGLLLYFMGKIIAFIVKNSSPKKSIQGLSKAVLNTLKDIDLIHDGARLNIMSDDLDLSISVSIKNATIHEQNIFNESIKELLSPIENPRYIIIKKNTIGKYNFKYSFACPTIIAKGDHGPEILNNHLKNIMGNMEAKYVYYDFGRKLILQCKKKSFIIQNAKAIKKIYKVTKYE
jgi:hypothetical protein